MPDRFAPCTECGDPRDRCRCDDDGRIALRAARLTRRQARVVPVRVRLAGGSGSLPVAVAEPVPTGALVSTGALLATGASISSGALLSSGALVSTGAVSTGGRAADATGGWTPDATGGWTPDVDLGDDDLGDDDLLDHVAQDPASAPVGAVGGSALLPPAPVQQPPADPAVSALLSAPRRPLSFYVAPFGTPPFGNPPSSSPTSAPFAAAPGAPAELPVRTDDLVPVRNRRDRPAWGPPQPATGY